MVSYNKSISKENKEALNRLISFLMDNLKK